MEIRKAGRSGLGLSVAGLGCNQFGTTLDGDASAAVVEQALAEGITHFDTADSYGRGASEEFLGAALGKRRDEVMVATKFSSPGGGQGPYQRGASRSWVLRACEASLRRLNTDYIDLYYLHFPDPATPVEETLKALDDLVRQGKVRYIACSNFSGWQIADAEHLARELGTERFVVDQGNWSLLVREVETEVIPACRHFDLGFVPFFPLAAGLLTGKYRSGQPFPPEARLTRNADSPFYARLLTEENLEKVERLSAWAQERDRSMVELALSWLAGRPEVTSVIVGATRPDQVSANVAAMGWQLTEDDYAAVDKLLRD
ncbi:MAG TPA: aldo/keto reductase [Acidimicrobiales bacterium]|nr:aldo/keto reductase [Acidimicrobiales bacterium]